VDVTVDGARRGNGVVVELKVLLKVLLEVLLEVLLKVLLKVSKPSF
jgi:hypothetical protein